MTASLLNLSALHNPQLPGEPFVLPGSGPDAVLLFHGFTSTPNEVLGLAKTLQQAGYSVYGPLLPGHGTRPRELNRTRWQDWAAAAELAFDDLASGNRAYRRVIVGGESLGGLLALNLAASRPEVSAVLAYAPALVIPFSAVEKLLLRLLSPLGIMLPKGDLKDNATWQGYRVNPLRGVLQVRAFQAVVLEHLPGVCAPALIAQGRRDKTINPLGAQEIYQSIGSSVKALHWFDDAPHCLLIAQQRQQVYDRTLEFLGQPNL